VGLPSLLVLRSKSFSHLKAIPTIPSAVLRAVKPGSQNVMGIVAIAQGLDVKCSPQYALSVAKTRKYHLSLAKVDQCIVAIATERLDPADNAGLTLRAYIGRNPWLMYALARMCWYVMSLEVWIREGESQDSLLRRFQRMVQVSGILREVKAHRYFLSKVELSRLKARKSARRRRRG